jgi:hypothetical protein
MTSETFKVVGIAQGSHELTGQTFSALSTDLAAALGLGDGLVLLSGVGGGSRGVAYAVVGRKGGRRGAVVCGSPHEAIAVGVVVIHRRRSLRWCAHVRLRQFRGW